MIGQLVIALVLGAIALGILWMLGAMLVGPALALAGGSKGSWKLRRATNRIARVDQLIEENKAVEAIKELRRCVYLRSESTTALVARAKEHHQNILSRCLVIAEELGSRAENIAEVERLFIERTELQVLLVKASERFNRVTDKREKEGRKMPDWGKADYKGKIQEIKKELARNQSTLQAELKKLFQSIATPSDEQIVYH